MSDIRDPVLGGFDRHNRPALPPPPAPPPAGRPQPETPSSPPRVTQAEICRDVVVRARDESPLRNRLVDQGRTISAPSPASVPYSQLASADDFVATLQAMRHSVAAAAVGALAARRGWSAVEQRRITELVATFSDIVVGSVQIRLGYQLRKERDGRYRGEPVVAVREDDHFDRSWSLRSVRGQPALTRKSFVDERGVLRPASGAGQATVAQHVQGREPYKSDSPYTSFKPANGMGKRYGEQTLTLDVQRLRQDIAAGKLPGTRLVENHQVLADHQRTLEAAKQAYRREPTAASAAAVKDAAARRMFSQRDEEILVQGPVPAKYFRIDPQRRPASSDDPAAAWPEKGERRPAGPIDEVIPGPDGRRLIDRATRSVP